ncbi:RNA-binding KH domain-containing protein [Euphorbia peplus]|nr:RNA-binding KH domain-containing protein [Euphorbia peplus]
MSAEVDKESAVEPHKIKMSTKNSSSGATTSGPKTSIFAAKSGFVIPKNKLSGSLVPIFKAGIKPGGNGASNEEKANQVTRKSKWGPDPTQDAAVRRARALAYQTRIDQITQQLMSGILEPEETQSSQVVEQPANSNLSAPEINFKVSEMLKLERREIIGEILKLNPSFKAPPDYEPLLKEATISIPVKDHPGYNFVGLIFGPGSDAQKRLEKETKARIQVFGTKADTGEKVQISASNVGETQTAYKELNIHVSAETFEKVDGAVALIELIITSVSENLAAGHNQNVLNRDHASGEQGVDQSVVAQAQTPLQGQFQYQGQGFSGISAQASGQLSPGFNLGQNSVPSHNNFLPVHSSPLNPSFYGSQPISASGHTSVHPSTSFVLSRPHMLTQVPSYPYPPRNFHMPVPHLSSVRPGSGVPQGLPSDRPLTPIGSSSGWSAALPSVSAPLGPGNMGQMITPMTSWPVTPQPGFMLSTPPSNTPAANAVPSISFSSGSSTMNRPSGTLSFASVPAPQVGSSSTHQSINSPRMVMPNSSLTTTSQLTLQSGIRGSFLGNTANPTLMRPPTVDASKQLHSGLVDFTFKPNPLQNSASDLRPSNQFVNPDNALLRPMLQTPSSEAQSFRLGIPNLIPSPGMHVFPRSQVSQMGQNQALRPGACFTGTSIPPRGLAFSDASPLIPPPIRNFNGAPQRHDFAGPLPPMRGNHPLHNYPGPRPLSGNVFVPNQQSSRNPFLASNPGGGQIYDPFSPT